MENHFVQFCKYRRIVDEYRSATQAHLVSKYKLEDFNVTPITDWVTHWHLWGPANTGCVVSLYFFNLFRKTQFALAHFKHPLYVRHADELGSFDKLEHDGIVIDEMDFCHWPSSAVINLLNKKDPQQIHIRYRVAHLPEGVKVVFCSNAENIFYDPDKLSPKDFDNVESIKTKIRAVHVKKKMYGPPPVPEPQDPWANDESIIAFVHKAAFAGISTIPKLNFLLELRQKYNHCFTEMWLDESIARYKLECHML